MAGIADIVANLRLNTSNFTEGIMQASGRLDAFANNMRRTLQPANVSNTTRSYQDIVDVADQFNISMDRARRALGITRSDYRNIVEQQRRWNAEIERSRFAFKDVARIIGGIIVARIFYSSLQAIRSATDAVWEFSKAVEYAQITYANLFGDTELSTEFINVLQDFAAETVFSFSEAESAARRLLSYGIQYKNVMYMMQGVMAGATITGNEQNVERISRALGQIYTKGRLMGEEMRQLAEAGVPAYEILIEKLGLTQKQLQNLGRESIPASKAINALVDGINERFGSVVNAAAFTTTGLINKIQDNALLLANGIFEPVILRIKKFLSTFANWLSDLREVYNKSGIGGVFESIIPPHLHGTFRTFFANVISFTHSLKGAFSALGMVMGQISMVFINLFNMIMPVITIINTALSAFMSTIFGTKVSVDILKVALTLATGALIMLFANFVRVTIVKTFVKAINLASRALLVFYTIMTRHPAVFFLSLLAIGVAGLAASNTKLGESIRNVTSSLTKMTGVDPNNIMMPESKKRASDLGKFNEKLTDTADAMEDLAGKTNKANKAGKAAKQLLSFDEVFKINEPDETTGAGAGAGIDSGDFEGIFDGLSGLGGDIEIPSFDGIGTQISDALFGSIKERMTSTITGAAIGGIIGAAIGSIFGQPVLGAKIGAAAGAIAGFFWKEIVTKFKELGALQESTLSLSIGAGIGAAIGYVLGGPAGAIIGTAVGALASGLMNMLWDYLAKAFGLGSADANNASIGSGIGAAIGGVIGAVIGGPGGAAIGAGIGLLVGGIVGLFWNKLAEYFSSQWHEFVAILSDMWGFVADIFKIEEGASFLEIGEQIIAGILTGMIAAVASLIAGLYKLLVEPIIDGICNLFGINSPAEETKFIGRYIIEGIWEGIKDTLGWFLGNISSWSTDITKGFTDWVGSVKTSFIGWKNDTFNSVSSWYNDTKQKFSDWKTNVSKTVEDWKTAVSTKFTDWKTAVGTTVDGWKTAVGNKFTEWRTTAETTFENWKNNTSTKVSTWKTNVAKTIGDWKTDVATKLSGWKTDAETLFENWKNETSTKVSTWKTNVAKTIGDWKTDVTQKIAGWSTSAISKIDNFIAKETGINNFCRNTLTKFTTWASDTWSSIKTNFTYAVDKLKEFTTMETSISTFCTNSLNKIKTWASDIWEGIKDKFNKAIEKVKEFIGVSNKSSTGGSTNLSTSLYGTSATRIGHATGGIFNKEHIARFAEGNKAEAVIPLENASAMQPFVDAISNGITQSLLPVLASVGDSSSSSSLPPLYVGTLIADERGLRELNKKMKLINIQEDARRGLT